MFKKLFFVLSLVLSLALAGNVMATGDCNGEPCEQVTATANPHAQFAGVVIGAPGSDGMNGGKAVGNFNLGGNALATGEDRVVTHKKYNRRTRRWESHTHFYKGEATAYGIVSPTMNAHVVVFTNGMQLNSGLSYSFVKSTASLNIEGDVWAKGNDGCLQGAEIFVRGSLGTSVYGSSFSAGPNGSFASAGGWGTTTVMFAGIEKDQSTHGFLWFPNKASVDFDSIVSVDQSLMSFSYVSPDGTTAGNFAYVGGGSAELNLGRDGLFGRDNINLTGIQATGKVSQYSMATNGAGAYASGGSSAYFSGANGTVGSARGWCGPDQYGNVGGLAVVGGYNNVTSSPGSITVTSKQFGYATTGNSAPQLQIDSSPQ